ncbi:Oidioi.mRNA.OKI2018_I69.chr1.g271.t1.cds [Oikopleura dioica]|uniref:Oidioi.mRNA.OKI2018_I69.chr1.g271.t1.cds n=1 Tax=Oikopleura dioica TaxID=34765 RepID=A0ABN7SQK2_OIKDI|nr:Oidioi.mRNA.OKI2018_I69.chr1.g271.t1.cds [Oikopleura dioica]
MSELMIFPKYEMIEKTIHKINTYGEDRMENRNMNDTLATCDRTQKGQIRWKKCTVAGCQEVNRCENCFSLDLDSERWTFSQDYPVHFKCFNENSEETLPEVGNIGFFECCGGDYFLYYVPVKNETAENLPKRKAAFSKDTLRNIGYGTLTGLFIFGAIVIICWFLRNRSERIKQKEKELERAKAEKSRRDKEKKSAKPE